MDKKFIAQYGKDILSYRLRTARQKKRAQREGHDKYLRRLHDEELALWYQRRSLGWEPLDPPVQRGWKRIFILRPDVARSRDADFFACILEKINTSDYHPRKDFLVKRRRKRWKKMVVKPKQLKTLHRSEFEKLTDAEKQFFHREMRMEKWSMEPVVWYAFSEPWRYVPQVKPNMVEKVRIVDIELEARSDQIRDKIERNGYRGRLDKVIHGRSLRRWHEPKDRCPDPFRNWSVLKIVEATKEEVYNV